MAAVLAALGLGTGTAAAAVHNESDLSGHQYALNNWSAGGYIRMGTQGAPNSDIGWHSVPRCTDANGNRSDRVQLTCPFANSALDREYQGDIISSLTTPSDGSGACLGNNGSHDHVVSSCPDFNTGAGGGNGTIFINYHTGAGCGNANEEEFVSRPESDAVGSTRFLHDPDVYGGYPSFGSFTCWVSANH